MAKRAKPTAPDDVLDELVRRSGPRFHRDDLGVVGDSIGITWTDPKTGVPILVDIRWDVIGGRAEPTRVNIYSAGFEYPITAEIVRRVPFGSIVVDERESRRKLFADAVVELSNDFSAEDLEGLASRVQQHSRDARLQEVANVYRRAFAEGRPVQHAVADHFDLTLSGASKKIAAARARGYLGEARGTTPGERQPEGTDR